MVKANFNEDWRLGDVVYGDSSVGSNGFVFVLAMSADGF
jgi:hypothetical protein